MSNHSVIEHRANYHFLKLEEDYVQICGEGEEYPHCKAFILSILEHWMNDKKAKGQDAFIFMSYPQWILAMYGMFRRNHVINALAELEKEQLIIRRPCRYQGKDTFEYALNVPEVQRRIKALEERTEKYTRPKINPFKFKRVEKQTGLNLNGSTHPNLNASEHDDPSKFKPTIDSSTEIPSDINSTRGSANAPAPAEISSEEKDLEKTEKRKATPSPKKEVADTHGSSPDAHKHPVVDRDLPAHSDQPDPPRADTNKVKRPPAPDKSHINTTPPKRPTKQGMMDILPSEEAVRIMNDWDSIFSRPCTRTENHIKAAELLVPCHPTRDDLSDIRKFCYSSNPTWYRDKGVSLQDVAKNFDKWQSHQEAPKPEKEPSNEHKAVQHANAFIARGYDKEYNKRKLEEMRAENERRRQAQAAGGVQ